MESAMQLTGMVVEIGELEGECGAHGVCIHREDGSLVTIKGLTQDETRALAPMLYSHISIDIAAL
jgi:hypothetical protein